MAQNEHGSTAPAFQLLSLPREIVAHVSTYLVPSNQTFVLNIRIPGQGTLPSHHDDRIAPRIRGSSLLPEHEAAPEHPLTIFSNFEIDVFTLLLSSKLYPHIVTSLYSNNTFYFPDLTTLHCLRETLSSLAISSIRTVRVDACGPAICYTRGYDYFYNWAQPADTNITQIPELFPNLRELRIGGIGAGVVQRRTFRYRGSIFARETDLTNVWDVDNISLVSKIICGTTSHDPETSGSMIDGPETAKGSGHALSFGRVFCMRYRCLDPHWIPRGKHRLHGTRIVKRGEPTRPRLEEEEVVDVAHALEEARRAQEEADAAGCE